MECRVKRFFGGLTMVAYVIDILVELWRESKLTEAETRNLIESLHCEQIEQ
jgi:hypothetical protein